jgi:hypothetical protein
MSHLVEDNHYKDNLCIYLVEIDLGGMTIHRGKTLKMGNIDMTSYNVIKTLKQLGRIVLPSSRMIYSV